jgi:hypothetical protein
MEMILHGIAFLILSLSAYVHPQIDHECLVGSTQLGLDFYPVTLMYFVCRV